VTEEKHKAKICFRLTYVWLTTTATSTFGIQVFVIPDVRHCGPGRTAFRRTVRHSSVWHSGPYPLTPAKDTIFSMPVETALFVHMLSSLQLCDFDKFGSESISPALEQLW